VTIIFPLMYWGLSLTKTKKGEPALTDSPHYFGADERT
jgi:hypothetical protein